MSDWKPILEELERRRAIPRAMGGAERVEREQRAGPWRMAAGISGLALAAGRLGNPTAR